MLPVLASVIQDLDLSTVSLTKVELPLVLEPISTTPVAAKASEVMAHCEQLLACYDSRLKQSCAASDVAKMRDTFSRDKDETIKAFEASKKLVINQLQVWLEGRNADAKQRFALSVEEQHLAKKIMDGDRQSGKNREGTSTRIGSLIYNFGKVVSKMQDLAE